MEQIGFDFGKGIYTATDVATILKLPYPKVGYWFRKHVKGEFESISNYRYYYDREDRIVYL